jgi:hypothetical protein
VTLNIKVAGDEKVLPVKVAKHLTIEELKVVLLQEWERQAPDGAPDKARASCPPSQVRLIFSGRQLETDKSMDDYCFGTPAGRSGGAGALTIHMVLPSPEARAEANGSGGSSVASPPAAGAAEAFDALAGGLQPKFVGAAAAEGGGRGKGAREMRKEGKGGKCGEDGPQELRIPCEARHYASGVWCRAYRGNRTSASQVYGCVGEKGEGA